MAESARHLVEDVFGPRPVRQWVLSFPYPLRFPFASKPDAIGPVLGIVHSVRLVSEKQANSPTLFQLFGKTDAKPYGSFQALRWALSVAWIGTRSSTPGR